MESGLTEYLETQEDAWLKANAGNKVQLPEQICLPKEQAMLIENNFNRFFFLTKWVRYGARIM